jgi:hypothetical protein
VTDQSWWSASVRLVVFVDEAAVDEAESVVLLRAPDADWDSAFQRAVSHGRGLERSYTNADGEQVAWRLREIRTLDQIGTEITDGREIHFTVSPLASDSRLTAADLRPEEARPGQSGI